MKLAGLFLYLLAIVSFGLPVRAQDCPRPSAGPNTILSSKDIVLETFPDGVTVRFDCEIGYAIVGGTRKYTCTAGTWQPALNLKCERKSCGSLGDPENGIIDYPDGIQFGDKAVLSCNTGYDLVGQKEVTCGVDGWMGRLGRCEVVKCPPPPQVVNAKYRPEEDEYEYGHVVIYTCKRGLTLNGSKQSYCEADGTFHPEPPSCVTVLCPTPDVPNLRRYEGPPPPYGYRAHVTFKCDDGFVMVGSASVTCEIGSEWSPPLPYCKELTTTTTTPPTTTTPTPTTVTTPTTSTPTTTPNRATMLDGNTTKWWLFAAFCLFVF